MIRILLVLTLALPLAAQDFDHDPKPGPNPTPDMEAANAALESHDWPKAVKLLQPLAGSNPKDAHILYDLGSAQDALDQTSPAEQSYRASILDDGGYINPRVALGLLLARNGRMEGARSELMAAAGLNPPGVPERLLRARALRALAHIDAKARPSEARDELLAALSISPETPEDTILTAELAEGANNGQSAAEAAYRALLVQQPNDPDATASLAHLLLDQKRYPEAEMLLTDGLAAHPANQLEDEPMTLQLAHLYAIQDKYDQAIPLIAALHNANPTEVSVTRLLAELYIDAKDYAHAEPLLATLTAQSSRDGVLIDLRSQALMHLQRPAEAQSILTPVVADPALFPTHDDWGSASIHLAFSASENNEPEVVLQVLANRAKVLPPSPPILFLTAVTQDKLHHVRLAVEAYKQFVAVSNGAFPNEEFEARHRLVALEHK